VNKIRAVKEMVIKTELAKIEFTVCPVNQLTEKSDWQIP